MCVWERAPWSAHTVEIQREDCSAKLNVAPSRLDVKERVPTAFGSNNNTNAQKKTDNKNNTLLISFQGSLSIFWASAPRHGVRCSFWQYLHSPTTTTTTTIKIIQSIDIAIDEIINGNARRQRRSAVFRLFFSSIRSLHVATCSNSWWPTLESIFCDATKVHFVHIIASPKQNSFETKDEERKWKMQKTKLDTRTDTQAPMIQAP